MRETVIFWFPKGPDIKCFVIFLDFYFNSNKRIMGANQSSRFGTYDNIHTFNNYLLKAKLILLNYSTILIEPEVNNCFSIFKRSDLTGLSLRAGGRGFSPATKRVAPGYFYWKIEEK